MSDLIFTDVAFDTYFSDMAASRFTNVGCKLSLMQKDLKLAINMSDAVDQPLHVGSAVNEVWPSTLFTSIFNTELFKFSNGTQIILYCISLLTDCSVYNLADVLQFR
jgi:hypothetical protein